MANLSRSVEANPVDGNEVSVDRGVEANLSSSVFL